MPNLKYILKAVKPEANINRVYEIYLNKGLFEYWVVTTANGRYGAGRGRQRNYSFHKIEQAQDFIHKTLKKRYAAKKRIGCNYELICCQGGVNSKTEHLFDLKDQFTRDTILTKHSISYNSEISV